MVDDITIVADAAVRLSIPLLFAAIGEWIAERAGTLNVSIEGMMLGGAFMSALASDWTGSATTGLVFGMAAGVVVGYIHGQFSHRATANTFVVGITLTILVTGLTSFLLSEIDIDSSRTSELRIPGLAEIPIIGSALFTQRWPAYLVWPMIPAAGWIVYRSQWGLECRAAGENPQAADVGGVPVNLRRRQSLLVVGATAGFGGAYLAVGEVGFFTQEMTAGRGFLALAAVIFGGWRLLGTVFGCVLFGTAFSLRLALPALGYDLNPQLLIMSPYILALLVMVIFAARHRRPAAIAHPFERGLA